jgi:hypothetical protein
MAIGASPSCGVYDPQRRMIVAVSVSARAIAWKAQLRMKKFTFFYLGTSLSMEDKLDIAHI